MKKIENILELVGNTPIKRLGAVTEGLGFDVWAKLEFLNPSGSLKDRIALKMIEDAEEKGQLQKGYTIIESSSGNTAIALSFVGGIKGYRRIIFMPKIMSGEKVEMIKRYGAEIRLVDVGEDLKGTSVHGSFIEVPGRMMCKKMEETTPMMWWARQFSNPSNYEAHVQLGQEILDQMDERVDGFVASVGTGGTLFGVGKILKDRNPDVKIIAVEPAECPYVTLTNFKVVEGVTGGILQEILDSQVVDQVVKVTDEDAIAMSHRLIQEEGLFAGTSGGANVFAAINLAKELGKGCNIATVLPDRGDRYITSEHYVT